MCEEFEKEKMNCNFLRDVDPMELAAYLVSNFKKKEFIKYGNYISLLFLLNEFYINQEEYIIESCDQIFDECLSVLKGGNYEHEFLLTKYLYNLASGSSERFKSHLMEFFSKTKNEKIILQNNESINIHDFIEQRKITSGAVLVIELLFELIQESKTLDNNEKVKKIYNLAVNIVWRLNDIFLFQNEKLKPNILNFEFEKEDKNNLLQSRVDILTKSIQNKFNNFLELTQKYCKNNKENCNFIKLLEDLVTGYLYFQLESGRYGIVKSKKCYEQISYEIQSNLDLYGSTPPKNVFTILDFISNVENESFLPSQIEFNYTDWELGSIKYKLCSPIAFSHMVINGKTPGELKTGAYLAWFFSQYHLCLKKYLDQTDIQCNFPTCFDKSDLFNKKTIESIIIYSLKPIRKEINKMDYYALKEKMILSFYRFIISKFILKYYCKNSKILNLIATAFENGEDIFLTLSSDFNEFYSFQQKKNVDLFMSSILLLCGRENDWLFKFNKVISGNHLSIKWDKNNVYHEHFLLDTQILYEDQMIYIRNINLKKENVDYNKIKPHLNFLLKWNEQLRTFREKNNKIEENSYYYQLNLMKKPLFIKNKNYYKNLEEIENAKKAVAKFLLLPKNILEKCMENIDSKFYILKWVVYHLIKSEQTSSTIFFDNNAIFP